MTVLPATSFRAMGTDVEVLGYPELLLHVADQVQARFLEVEAALSRFRPGQPNCRGSIVPAGVRSGHLRCSRAYSAGRSKRLANRAACSTQRC